MRAYLPLAAVHELLAEEDWASLKTMMSGVVVCVVVCVVVLLDCKKPARFVSYVVPPETSWLCL